MNEINFNSDEFRAYLNCIIHGNSDNFYTLYEDGTIGEFTDSNGFNPARTAIFKLRRNPAYKKPEQYLKLIKFCDDYELRYW